MRLGDTAFFHLLERIAAATNSDRNCDEWSVDGVRWRRQRHVHWAQTSFQIELYELHHSARPRWTLLYVHEIWWGEDRAKAIRNARWTHLESGETCDVLVWFQERGI